MVQRTSTQEKPPYSLPPLPKLESSVVKTLDRWEIQKFLSIEGLLRSKAVWDLYRQAVQRTARKRHAPPMTTRILWNLLSSENIEGKEKALMHRLLWDNSLRERFNIEDGWAVLWCSHHRYLQLRDSMPFRIGNGIVDLSVLHKSRDFSFKLKYLEVQQSRNLYLMIDCAEVSLSSDLAMLKQIIRKRQKAETRGFMDARLFNDIHAWLEYLHCYDLHGYQGKSATEVSRIVYGAESSRKLNTAARKKKNSDRRKVVRACREVTDLIAQAVKCAWQHAHL